MAKNSFSMEQKPSKYKNIKTTREFNGTTVEMDSLAEARRFDDLYLMLKNGMIERLVLQYRYPLAINEQKICTYVADFVYYDCEKGHDVVEDVKGFITPYFRLKKKLMKAIYDIDVVEIRS